MVAMNNRVTALACGLAVVVASWPCLAQRVEDNGGTPISAARAEALRECNARAQPYLDKDWGVRQSDIYRACMAEHHQPE
jgi:hypothetical protein